MSGFNILISVVLAKRYGAVGAAFGTTIAIVVCNIIIMNIYYYKVIKLDIIKFWKNIFGIFIKYLIPICIIIGIMYFTNVSGIKSVIIYGSTYTLIYMIVTYFIVCDNYEKNIINSVLKKLKLIKE